MDKPVFIRCEECGGAYKEFYVNSRESTSVSKGKCGFCLFKDFQKGEITYEDYKEKLEQARRMKPNSIGISYQ